MTQEIIFCNVENKVSKKNNPYAVLITMIGGKPVKFFVSPEIATKAANFKPMEQHKLTIGLEGDFEFLAKVNVLDIN